jgi:hypothetical protein
VNVRIVNGEGQTNCPSNPNTEKGPKFLCNDEGNLVIGHDETNIVEKGLGFCTNRPRTGSHDLILGVTPVGRKQRSGTLDTAT